MKTFREAAGSTAVGTSPVNSTPAPAPAANPAPTGDSTPTPDAIGKLTGSLFPRLERELENFRNAINKLTASAIDRASGHAPIPGVSNTGTQRSLDGIPAWRGVRGLLRSLWYGKANDNPDYVSWQNGHQESIAIVHKTNYIVEGILQQLIYPSIEPLIENQTDPMSTAIYRNIELLKNYLKQAITRYLKVAYQMGSKGSAVSATPGSSEEPERNVPEPAPAPTKKKSRTTSTSAQIQTNPETQPQYVGPPMDDKDVFVPPKKSSKSKKAAAIPDAVGSGEPVDSGTIKNKAPKAEKEIPAEKIEAAKDAAEHVAKELHGDHVERNMWNKDGDFRDKEEKREMVKAIAAVLGVKTVKPEILQQVLGHLGYGWPKKEEEPDLDALNAETPKKEWTLPKVALNERYLGMLRNGVKPPSKKEVNLLSVAERAKYYISLVKEVPDK